jgi:imidazolonepropionase-like amidohydrolase
MTQRSIFILLVSISLLLNAGCEQKSMVSNMAGEQQLYDQMAVVKVNLVPMTSETVVPNQTVLIQGTRIAAVGPAGTVTIPDNALVIDGAGKYLMPGLADMHIHTTHTWQTDEWPVSPMKLFLASGVTTVRDFGPKGHFNDYPLHWRRAIEKGRIAGPTIYGCGGIIYGPVADPEKEVVQQSQKGFHFIKPYSFLSPKEYATVMATAKRRGMYVAGHIPFQVGLKGILQVGMDEIAHVEELAWEFINFDKHKPLVGHAWLPYVIKTGFLQFEREFHLNPGKIPTHIQEKSIAMARKLSEHNIPVCSTLTVDDVIQQKLFKPREFETQKTSRFLPPAYLERFRAGKEKHQMQFKGGEKYAPLKYQMDKLLLKSLKKQEVQVLLATDTGSGGMGIVPGFSLHRELQILVENGYTPYEAIAAGTSAAGGIIGRMIGKNEFGTIEVGKRADLLLVGKNPLLDVAHVKDLRGVMAAGRWYDDKTLQQMLVPGIPVTAVVRHVVETDGRSTTQFEVLIGKSFSGKLPEAIVKIQIDGPGGLLSLKKSDFRYINSVRAFWASVPEQPQIGTYVFRVTDGKRTGLATNTQSVVRKIDLPTVRSLSPANQSVLTTETPTFSWAAVEADYPVFYRFEIYQSAGPRLYSTGYRQNMLSHQLSPGVLKPGQSYRWRVRVTDGPDWFSVQNRAQTKFRYFHVTASN